MTYVNKPHRNEVRDWLLSKKFIIDRDMLCIAWSKRNGMDWTDLEFYPLERYEGDIGWDAIVGHHASGTNPRLIIGRCETLADIQMVYETIKHINGYPNAEE